MTLKFWKRRKVEVSVPTPTELLENQKTYLIKEFETYLLSCRENKKYSNQKLDYLLVGLSASGVVLLLGMAKDFKDKITSNKEIFIISIVCFVLCIILNFVSQLIALTSNVEEIKITKAKLMDLEFNQYSETKHQKIQNQIDSLDLAVWFLNRACTVLVLVGMIAAVIFWAAVAL